MSPTHSLLCIIVWTAIFQQYWLAECSLEDSQNTATVAVESRITTIELPRGLTPGPHRCQWNLILNRFKELETDTSDKPDKGIKIDFDTRLSPAYNGGYDRFIGYITVAIPSLRFSNERFAFQWIQWYPTTRTVESFNNSIITLEIDIKSSDYGERGVFLANVSTDSTITNLPRRFMVRDIIGETKFITNYRFKWIQARRFCKDKGLDLCPRHQDHVCSKYHPFSHEDVKMSIQYIPVLPYNTWGQVTGIGKESCETDVSGPPFWGIGKSECPPQGCESKSYIYCCDSDSNYKLTKYEPIYVFVFTARDANGTVYYRFSEWDIDEVYDYNYYYRWSDFWKEARRNLGDVSKFTASTSYSRRTPSALYVCHKTIDSDVYGNVQKYRYMLDLKPCQHPWKYKYHVYVSEKPTRGLRPLYVGQSKHGHGSRVSTLPPCCGYTDPKSDFVIYAEYKGRDTKRTESNICSKLSFADATFNATSVTSKSWARRARSPIYCKWRINANPGNGTGLTIKYSISGGYHQCRYNYLRMQNPRTGRIFSEASLCDRSGSFTTDDSSVELILSVEGEERFSFSLTYSTAEKSLPTPEGFEVTSENRTWEYARNFCREKSLELCTREQICPSGRYPYGGIRDSWIAVADRFNEWIKTTYTHLPNVFHMCQLVSLHDGPPIWSVEMDPKRDIVYCCDGPKVHLPKSETVRVNVGFNRLKGGVYWFGKADKWESPAYDDGYHPDYPYNDYLVNTYYSWKPPSTINSSVATTVDYFKLSSQYVEGIFDRVVYFCLTPPAYIDSVYFENYYKASLEQCRLPWKHAFHLYGGDTQNMNASFAISFGKGGGPQELSCCEKNPDNFTIHAIDAGRLDSYTHPVASDEYYYEIYFSD